MSPASLAVNLSAAIRGDRSAPSAAPALDDSEASEVDFDDRAPANFSGLEVSVVRIVVVPKKSEPFPWWPHGATPLG